MFNTLRDKKKININMKLIASTELCKTIKQKTKKKENYFICVLKCIIHTIVNVLGHFEIENSNYCE